MPVGRDQLEALALTNYGHFTTMLVERGGVRGLSLHLDRLVDDCRAVFDVELDPDRVRALIRRATRDSDHRLVIRVTVFDPGLGLGHPGGTARPGILVNTRPTPETATHPVRLASVGYVRELPRVKHTGLFATLHHRRAVQRSGFDDALFTTADALVCEAATSNIGFIDSEDRIVWPDADCLPGITMRLIARGCDPASRTTAVPLAHLPRFTAAFLTNAAVGVRPVAAVDGNLWRTDHPALRTLRKQYDDIAPEPI